MIIEAFKVNVISDKYHSKEDWIASVFKYLAANNFPGLSTTIKEYLNEN